MVGAGAVAVWFWSNSEEISHIQGQRRSPSKMVGGVKSHLESNSIPPRDAQRAQTYLGRTRTQTSHKDWARTVECLLWRYRSAVDCCRNRGSGYSRPGYGISPHGGSSHHPHHRAARTYTGLLEDTNRTLCAQGPRRKKQRHHKRLTQICPEVSSRGVGQWWTAGGLGSLSVAVHAWDILKEVAIIFITSTVVWLQVNSRKGAQLHALTENWIKDLLNVDPPIRTRPSFPLSFSHQEASWSFLSFTIKGQTDWKPQSQKLTSLITWITALFNSMKLQAMLCRATQDGRVMVEGSDKTWSTGEGNGKPLQYSCLENPMNRMKRQKDRTLKEELPRSVGAQ